MVILALETVTRRGSLALWDTGVVHTRHGDDSRTHGARLPGEILVFLADHGRSLADIDVFAIVSGPGSFTGLRVGLASVQGLALAGGRQVIPVPTLEAMAECWCGQNPRTPDPETLLVPCLDGQRGDVFFAGWALTASTGIDQAREVLPSSVGKPGDLRRALESLCAAPLERIVLFGDGARRHAAAFGGMDIELHEVCGTLAGAAAAIAWRRRALAVAPHALRPLYIRRPDAELARERAGFEPARTKGLA